MRQFATKAVLLVLCACLAPPLHARSFFKGNFERPADIPASDGEAARFLTQATFGPTQADIDKVRTIGVSAWIDQQMLLPATRVLPYMLGLENVRRNHNRRMDRHLHSFMVAPDQLRQRMAFALSQIFVISSQHPGLINDNGAQQSGAYWDMLADAAFDSYAPLLQNVTYHVTMGKYLSHFRNRKAGPGHEPDENYAREIMQLFSVGLKELNIDGSPVLDTAGRPIPTYSQDAITDLAKVFTGFTFGNAGADINSGSFTYFGPMKCLEAEHDKTAKTVIGNSVLPAGRTCPEEVRRVVNLLSAHANTAPFIARRLIQRFTTSNPSRAYVRRVAEKFRDNGDGEYGDLGAVVRQILIDPEARQFPPPATFGKVREPLLQVTAILRAWPFQVPGVDANGSLPMAHNSVPVTQVPLSAPSVFNFYEPDHQPPGTLQAAGLYAPELQPIDEATIYDIANGMAHYGFSNYFGSGDTGAVRPYIRLDTLGALPDAQLIEDVNRRMLYGTMSPGMRAILAEMLPRLASGRERARSAILLTALSPEFAVQR
ncbi:uncharacterized protein (DUF1800 family) [Tahibacter aquaticus]|uniref:Uncharacterized protein (DUF1800 family) n=1 Tax=Tahibacter aquaticus TaxID=520092 RepID=A0A4R6YTZ6_9GAMM|nr:DUF1800 family protein [Tahibacter aquaticus]TDR41994.1 uncharacterized protein (DUF1800 family) [Tahibacter aquaticus]